MADERMVPTPHGDARLVVRRAKRPIATLVLTHGAGGGVDAPDLVRLARTLPQQDISVTLVEMPWRVAGKKLAPAPPVIDECFAAVLDTHAHPQPAGPRRPQRRCPLGLPDRPRRRRPRGARPLLPAAPARAAGEVAARRSSSAPGVRTLVDPGRARPVRHAPRSSPTTSTWPSCPPPTTR